MDKLIRKQILELADEDYKKFHINLLPNGEFNVIGVRVPKLRKLAKEISKGNFREYLNCGREDYYEEIMLKGMIIGCAKMDLKERLKYVEIFVPKINNWAICDVFCAGLKFTKKSKEEVLEFIKPYLESDKEFYIRFAIVMLLDFYIDEEHINEVLEALDKIKNEGYYVKMAIAWNISICYIKFPKETMEYLKNNTLDKFTYNKALQKITESLRVDKDTKVLIRGMKK